MSRVSTHEHGEKPRRFRRYPTYKRSPVEWLEAIPKHWEVRRLRSTVESCQNGVWGEEPDGLRDTPCVRVADFDRVAYRVDFAQPTLRSIEPALVAARGLRPGDLLLEKSGGGENQPVGAVVLFDHHRPAVCSNFVARVVITDGHSPRYQTYIHAALYAQRVNRRHIKQSTGIQNLDSSSYFTEFIAFPAEPEQQAIAAFLDRETAKIDALIARKERLIELLQEKRSALITRAVMKGLDPNVPMKSSGVEWLGEIPAHWESRRTKFAARLRSGHTPSRQHPEYWENCTIPWFGLSDVWQIRDGRAEYVVETAEKISELGLANSAARLLPRGTVMLSRTASVGFSAIMGVDMATTQDFVNWVCGPTLRPEFLLYVFRSMGQEFKRLTMGSTHQTIYMPDVGRFSTPVPPVHEQDEIVARIRSETSKLDALIAKVREAIDRLREFRTALISAAVTGKIDVRGEVPGEREPVQAG
jgi:type I restriction enzyme S subunit